MRVFLRIRNADVCELDVQILIHGMKCAADAEKDEGVIDGERTKNLTEALPDVIL